MNNIEQIIQQYIDAYNAFDIEGMTAHMHPDIVFENISSGGMNARTEGLEDFKELARKSIHLFLEREQRVQQISISGDEVVVDVIFTAVLAFDLSDELPANEEILLNGKSVFRFDGNKIIGLKDIS